VQRELGERMRDEGGIRKEEKGKRSKGKGCSLRAAKVLRELGERMSDEGGIREEEKGKRSVLS
jgi:hypothetical protein